MSELTNVDLSEFDAEYLADAAELASLLRNAAGFLDRIEAALRMVPEDPPGVSTLMRDYADESRLHAQSLRGIADALAPEDNEHWVLTGEALTLAMEKFNESDCKRIDEQFNS